MGEWWNSLELLNQVFYGVAIFFSVVFLWQFIATLIGMIGGESDVDVHGDADIEVDADMDAAVDVDGDIEVDSDAHVGASETMAAFKMLSVRSIIAFGMLFGWAGALYLDADTDLGTTLILSFIWAFAGMLVVASIFYLMRRMTETGTPAVKTCVGRPGTVYMNIPPGGAGKVRTMVSGVLSVVNARSTHDELLTQGVPVKIVKMLNQNTVEVEKAD